MTSPETPHGAPPATTGRISPEAWRPPAVVRVKAGWLVVSRIIGIPDTGCSPARPVRHLWCLPVPVRTDGQANS
jgi:hypothetical protein